MRDIAGNHQLQPWTWLLC